MNSRRLEQVVWGGLGLVIFVILATFIVTRTTNATKKTASSAWPVLSTLGDFQLTNQLGQAVSLAHLRGKFWLANIIFTRCPGPCARLTGIVSSLQTNLADIPALQLISLTADPEFDSPPVLAKYGKKFGADENRWWFLTGKKSELYRLATTNNLMLIAQENRPDQRASENDLFTHSLTVVLVDPKGRMRAHFNSEDPQLQEKIRQAIRELEKETP